MINIVMETERADKILHRVNKANEARYIERRPSRSLNDDHQRGNMDILSMYKATERLVTVAVVLYVLATSPSPAVKKIFILAPVGKI